MIKNKSNDKQVANSRTAQTVRSTPDDGKDAVARETRKLAILTKRKRLFRAVQELERIRSETLVELYELTDEYDELCKAVS